MSQDKAFAAQRRAKKPERKSFRSNVVKATRDGVNIVDADQWPTATELKDHLNTILAGMPLMGIQSISVSADEGVVLTFTPEKAAAIKAAEDKKLREKQLLRAINSHVQGSYGSLKAVRKDYAIAGLAFQPEQEVTAEAVAQWVRPKNEPTE